LVPVERESIISALKQSFSLAFSVPGTAFATLLRRLLFHYVRRVYLSTLLFASLLFVGEIFGQENFVLTGCGDILETLELWEVGKAS
jgi:hypothetical protein